MPKPKSTTSALETVEPIGNRVLIRKDEDKKVTKVGIHLPDKIEIPTLTGRIVAISARFPMGSTVSRAAVVIGQGLPFGVVRRNVGQP